MPKQFIVRLYKNAPPGSAGSELVANSQVITIEGLGSTAVTARDFVDGQLTGTVTTGGQIGVFYKRLSQPLWTVTPVSDSVNAGTSFTFNVTVNLPYTENIVKWYVVDVGTEIPYSGGGIPNTTASIIFSGSGTTASFVILTNPIQTIQTFQVVLVNGNLGTGAVLARSATCFISPIILSIVPASPQQRKFGESAAFTVSAYPYEQVSWTGASTGVGVTNGSGIYIGTLGTTLPPGVNTVTFQGNITNQELLYTVNVTTDDVLLVLGQETATVGQTVNWSIRGKANQLVYWTGQHDVNDSGSGNTGAGNLLVQNFGKLQSGTYTWKFRGDGVPNVVTKQLILTPISGLSLNYAASYVENDPINVTVSAASGDTITWTYIPATLLQPAYFDYYPDVAEAYNNTQGLIQVATTIIGTRNNIRAAEFAEEVQGWYQKYLKRYADQNGLDYYVNQLVNDLSADLTQIRSRVESGIKNSAEAQTVSSTGQRISALSTLEFAQEHYRVYGSATGRLSPADLSVRENNFPPTGNTTVMTGVTSKSVDIALNNPNLIPRTTPYTFRFTGISSSPPATAEIKITKKYGLYIIPDQYPSGSTLTNNALILITVFGAPGEYVTVTPAGSPSTFIHTFTMASGQYTFDLLQYAKKVLANGSNLPNSTTYTMVFNGDKTSETPTYTFEILASAALNITTNQAPRVSQGDAIPVSISGAAGEKISWTYTIPSNFSNVDENSTEKQGEAFFELYQGVAEAYRSQSQSNTLTRYQFADALFKQWSVGGVALYMSPFNALKQILTNPPRSGAFQTLTNSSGVLSVNLAADLNLPPRASPYTFTFTGNISTGSPSLNVTVISPQILELVVPSQGYVNEPILINIVGAAGETVVLTRNPATNSTVQVPLETQGSRGSKTFDIASGTTFAPGPLTITAKGDKTINLITKTIQIYQNINTAPPGTVDGLGMSLDNFVQISVAGGVEPEFTDTNPPTSRWYATNTKNNINYRFSNAADVQIKASPGYAYCEAQSFVVRDWTVGAAGVFEHIPGKSLTYRLFARNGARNFNTGEIDTNNKPSIYVPGFKDSTFFVTSPYSYGTTNKIYFTFNRYVLWRSTTKPTTSQQYNYITLSIKADAGVTDKSYNIDILDAATNTSASYLKCTRNLTSGTENVINTILTSLLDTIYVYPNPDYLGSSGPISANIVIRTGGVAKQGNMIGWKIVTLLDPNQSQLPTAGGTGTSNTITTPLAISVENANSIYTGTPVKLIVNYVAGKTLAIYAGFSATSLTADSSKIKEVKLTSATQTIEVSGGLTITGQYQIYVVDVSDRTQSKTTSVGIQPRT